MKSILMSIQPKWVAKILNGEKTVEIRKTIPKCDLPIDVYIYCTKGKPNITDVRNKEGKPYTWVLGDEYKPNLNGKVVAKFTLNKGYTWHIDNLEIFDKPKELSEFYSMETISTTFGFNANISGGNLRLPLTKAPQSMMYIEV